jgi:hypothetical protein
MRPPADRLRAVVVAWLVPALIGMAGAWLVVDALGPQAVKLGPFRVRLEARLGRGVTDIVLPPLGTLRANTHVAPLHLRATLQDVDVDQLRALLTDPTGPQDLAARIEREAIDHLWPFALRVLALAAIGSVAVGALTYRRGRPAMIALIAGLLAVGGSEALAAATFDARAFLAPSYSGSLSLVPELFGPIQGTVRRVGYFRDELERIVDSAARAYTAIEANPLRGDEIRVLHISDIHLSTLGYDYAHRLADSFDVDLVLDTGDTASFGTPAEAAILTSIPGFDRPYVWVRGSHDSIGIQAAVTRYRNAVVLDGNAASVGGLSIFGLGDPYYVQGRGAPKTDEEIRDLVSSAGPTVVADIASLPEPPDIVAVHDDRMAEAAAGQVPLVVSGHFHENASRVIDGTLFLRVGTTGGAGPTGFTAEGGVPLSAEILYFRPLEGGSPALVAYDVVEEDPATGNFSVTRHLVTEEFGELSPSPPESPTPAPTPSEASTTGPSGSATPGP